MRAGLKLKEEQAGNLRKNCQEQWEEPVNEILINCEEEAETLVNHSESLKQQENQFVLVKYV